MDDAPTTREDDRTNTGAGAGDFEDFFRSRFAEVARAMMLAAHDRDLGEQIAAESFTRVFERWASFETEDHAQRFAYRTALNLATSHHRSERRWSLLRSSRGQELGQDPAPGPEEATANRAAVFQALRTLSPMQRACAVLVDYADFDPDEAAVILGIAASTVRVHLTRARRSLRAALGAPDEELEP